MQEAWGVVVTFMDEAEAIEGCTIYGTTEQRYEAALRPSR